MRRTHARVMAGEGRGVRVSEQSDIDAITSILTCMASVHIDAVTSITYGDSSMTQKRLTGYGVTLLRVSLP
jgi:glutathione S-transferase